RLAAQVGLNKDELAEVSSPTYTPLDAHHLEACFLLRDAARTLELGAVTGGGKAARQTPLDRAVAGFAWVVRQGPRPPPHRQPTSPGPAPPAPVLRRGQGSPLERALVFLALLERFGLDEDAAAGLQGCLVLRPGGEKGEPRLWACGVAVGAAPDALYLFDPRLGLPIPGPGGKGAAPLAQAASHPSVPGHPRGGKGASAAAPQQPRAGPPGPGRP